MTSEDRPLLSERALFLGLFALLLALKVAATWGTTGMNLDGGYYVDVARYVRDGRGLLSSSSLYHMGYPWLPYSTAVYPLWPLILGTLARVLPMEALAHWLPALLYLGAVGAAWGLGRRVAPGPLLSPRLPGVHGGFVLAVLLAFDSEFFVYTSMPYTEGLGWLLLLLMGWRLSIIGERSTRETGLELGIWASMLVLCRAQFLLVPIALAMAWTLRLLGPGRRQSMGPGLVLAGVFLMLVGAWLNHIQGFLLDAGPLALLRFDQARATDALPPMDVLVHTEGLLAMVLDRAQGLPLAFDLSSSRSYAAHLYTWPLALPLGLVAGAAAAWSHRARWPWLLSPAATPWLTMGLFALGGLASIHLAHKSYEPAWYFHRRHALVVIPGIYAGLLLLLRSPWSPARWTGWAILLSGLLWGLGDLATRAAQGRVAAFAATDGRAELVSWLNTSAAAADGATVVALMAHEPQRIAWRTSGVGYHWFDHRSTPDDLATICGSLGASLVIFRPGATADWAFRPFVDGLVALPEEPDGFRIARCPPETPGRTPDVPGPQPAP